MQELETITAHYSEWGDTRQWDKFGTLVAPQLLTWRQIADIIGTKTDQRVAQPFSASAASIFVLMGFVAAYQPHWGSAPVVEQLGLPPTTHRADYLDLNYHPQANR